MSRYRGSDSLTEEFRAQVARIAGTETKAADWFFRYIETGDATGAVIDAGYGVKQPANKAFRLVKRFRELIIEASHLKAAALNSMALGWLEESLRTPHMKPLMVKMAGEEVCALDGTGKPIMVPDPRLMAVKNRAADSILDRGWLPKGIALHGTSPFPAGEGPSRDFKILLEHLVELAGGGSPGAQIVLGFPDVSKHKEYRDYLLEQYPQPKMINAPAEPQSSVSS